MKTKLSIFQLIVSLPALCMSFYITHELLEFIKADRLLWFFYWSLIPLTILTQFLATLLKNIDD